MEYIKNIIKEILTEEARITDVSNAIRQRKEVKINYEADDEPKGKGERIIQPVAYGLSKAGNLVLRAFQPYGDTKTKVPHWKMFRLDKILNWKTLWGKTFNEPPAQYPAEGEFNKSGDKTMSRVYLVANFERSKEYYDGKRAKGLFDYNKKRQEMAAEKDPLYKFKQNLNRVQKTNDVTQRVKNNPSKNAREYVTNDDYIKDMEKVKNNAKDIQPQTSGPIYSGDSEGQNNVVNIDNTVNVENNGPIEKNKNF